MMYRDMLLQLRSNLYEILSKPESKGDDVKVEQLLDVNLPAVKKSGVVIQQFQNVNIRVDNRTIACLKIVDSLLGDSQGYEVNQELVESELSSVLLKLSKLRLPLKYIVTLCKKLYVASCLASSSSVEEACDVLKVSKGHLYVTRKQLSSGDDSDVLMGVPAGLAEEKEA